MNDKEILNDRQPWLPHPGTGVRSVKELLAENSQSPGRYKIPSSLEKKLLLNFQQKAVDVLGFDDAVFLPDDFQQLPPRWQAIIHYLYESGMINAPAAYFENLFNDEPKIYSLRLIASAVNELTDGNPDPMNGGYSRGVSYDLDEAISKVIGELLERYPLAIYRDKNLFRASVKNLRDNGEHFLNPFFVSAFSEEQKQMFPNRQFDENSIFRWVKGKSLMTGKEAFIPAQMVFWNYRYAIGEPFIQQPITNGAGGMFTLTEAILAGLYELIQRDAFFVHWFNKIAPPRIEPDSVEDAALQKIFEDIKKCRLRAEILDITSDLQIPAFICVLLDYSGKGPAVSIGGGCGPEPEAAIMRAVTESLGVRHWLRETEGKLEYPSLPDKPFSEPLGQRERLLLWSNPSVRHLFDFLVAGKKFVLEERKPFYKIKKSAAGQELSFLKEILRKRGPEYEIFYFEARHPVLDALGYHSVSVAVPVLIPLYLNETCAPVGTPRIREAAFNMGREPAKEINSLPHPFP